jgi:hypothetical protein
MHNCCPLSYASGLTSSDYIAILAIIVSVASLLFSVYFIYLTKRVEILYQEFENLCIKNVEKILSGLDKIFDENESDKSNDYRSQITYSMLELQGFLVTLKESIYNKIDVKYFITLIEEFTEKIYGSTDATLLDFKGDYYSTKLKIYNALYKYAVEKELRIFFLFKNK